MLSGQILKKEKRNDKSLKILLSIVYLAYIFSDLYKEIEDMLLWNTINIETEN